MPQVTWAVGDEFSFSKNGYGVVIQEGQAILVMGNEGEGYFIRKGEIPEKARPWPESIPNDHHLVLWGAAAAVGVFESLDTSRNRMVRSVNKE